MEKAGELFFSRAIFAGDQHRARPANLMQAAGQAFQNRLRCRPQVGNRTSSKSIQVREKKPTQAASQFGGRGFRQASDMKALGSQIKFAAPEVKKSARVGAAGELTQVGPAFGDTVLFKSFRVVKAHADRQIDRKAVTSIMET